MQVFQNAFFNKQQPTIKYTTNKHKRCQANYFTAKHSKARRDMDMQMDLNPKKEATVSDRKRKNAIGSKPTPTMRCKSPYICYTLEMQYKIAAELGPNATVDEIARKLAVTWHKMTQEEREPWVKQAKGDKMPDDSKTANGSSRPLPTRKKPKKDDKPKVTKVKKKEKSKKSKRGSKEQKGAKSKKDQKDPTKPKRPVTAYIFFSQKVRPDVKAKYPHLKGLGITKHIGEMWNNTDDKDKEPYQKLEKESRRRYQVAMDEWRRKQSVRQHDHVDEENKMQEGNESKMQEEVPPEESKTIQTKEMQNDHTKAEVDASPSADDTDEDVVVEEESSLNPGAQVYLVNPGHELQANLLLNRVPMPFMSTRNIALQHMMARMPGGNITGAIPMVHLPTMQAYFINQGHPMQHQMGSFSRSCNQGEYQTR